MEDIKALLLETIELEAKGLISTIEAANLINHFNSIL